ncbi:hypothetical protein ABHF54_13175 [Nitrosomonas europaea]|uniref:hypothetical protein n=1 Tax=Nitrosomonas europaea TaxID=915 RepID=UPI003266E715
MSKNKVSNSSSKRGVIRNNDNKQSLGYPDIKHVVVLKLFDLAQKLISSITYTALGYFTYLSIDSLAGKTTIANVVLSYFLSKDNDYGLPWILAVIFFLWATFERKERLRKVEALHKHNRDLEKRIDPNRTNSGILPNGKTNPKDERL